LKHSLSLEKRLTLRVPACTGPPKESVQRPCSCGPLLKLVADLVIIHVMLVLEEFRMQELHDHGSFHTDFK
jgi:hypothetical protein